MPKPCFVTNPGGLWSRVSAASGLVILWSLLLTGALRAEQEAAFDKNVDPVSIYKEAGVSAEQETKIRQMAQEYEQSSRVRVERIRNLAKQLKDYSYETELDEKKLLGLQDEMNNLHARLNTDRLKLMISIRGLLSAEQKEKLVQLMKEKQGEPTANTASGTTGSGTSSPAAAP